MCSTNRVESATQSAKLLEIKRFWAEFYYTRDSCLRCQTRVWIRPLTRAACYRAAAVRPVRNRRVFNGGLATHGLRI